ncbi:hypothetical protein NMG60_11008025 [Bertholletia excelsa]
MENLYLIGSLLGLSLLLISVFNYTNYKPNPKLSTAKEREKCPPAPGTMGWPIIGETLDYYSNLRRGSLEKFVADRRNKYASEVFTTSIIGYPMAILCGAEGNKLLFSNENKLVQVWFPQSFRKLFSKSQDAPKVRRILSAFLRSFTLHKFVGTIDSLMKHRIIQTLLQSEEAKAGRVASVYTMAVACRLLLGIDDPVKVEKLHQSVKDVAGGLVTMGVDLPGTGYNRAVKATRSLSEELRPIVKQRRIDLLENRANQTKDILSHMLLATDDDGKFLEDEDIATYLLGLLHGGYEPTKAAITFIIKYLAELPLVYQKVLKEQTGITKTEGENELLNWEDISKMKYSWMVANEVFRLTPPVLGTFREAIADFTFAGHTIQKGTKIHWTSHFTHRDPDCFPNPEKFDPSRFEGNGPPPYSFVPFGGGPRMCPANEYTRCLVLVFMHNMVTKFRWDLLDPNEKVVYDPLPRPTQGLPIRLHPRNP